MISFITSLLIFCVFGTELPNLDSRLLDLEWKLVQAEHHMNSLETRISDDFKGSVPLGEAATAVQAAPAGNLPTKIDWYNLPGFDCGDHTSDGGVRIYYPATLEGTYPIVSFLHGSGGGKFDALCSSIASLGIVVVAVDGGVCGDWSNQQVHAVLGSQQRTDLHPALAHVDFTRVGIAGHSEGSAYTQGTAAFHKDLSVKAAVMSHGGGPNAASAMPKDLPVYYATGTKDPKRRILWQAFNAAPSRPAIFANVVGATHMAPVHSGPQNAFMAHFLGCYLLPSKKSCDMIFSDQDGSLCHSIPMANCDIRLPENESDEYDYADPVPAPVFENVGDFDVDQGWYTLPGFDCGDGTFRDGGVLIYFPAKPDTRPDMKYPIASFLHGSGGGRFDGLCRTIASKGIVVVAVNQGTCGDWSDQQMYAVTGSQKSPSLHMALQYVDFSSIGVIGHSEGGAYSMKSATRTNDFPIKAGVFSHGGSENAAHNISKALPTFFVSGSADPRRHRLYWAFGDTPSVPKIWAVIAGGKHMWPAHGSPMNVMMAHFLACYLVPNKESCDIIYGDAPDSLCKANPMKSCTIVKEDDSADEYDYIDPVPAPIFKNDGDFDVDQGWYTLPGFDCGDGTFGDGGVLIYFPAKPDTRPDMKYPIASFLHGSGGGRFDGLCRTIASRGIVVVAVNQGTCGEWSVQQMYAVTGSQKNQTLHTVLQYVDFSSIGVIGHSEGGAYTMESATKANDFPIKAGVFSHGGSQNAAPDIPKDLPTFFVSGTADPRRRKLYWAFQGTISVPRIFATILGGKHMYPAHGSPMNVMMAHFLACYLIPSKDSCEIIYGDGPDSLCKANPMGDCTIIKNDGISAIENKLAVYS